MVVTLMVKISGVDYEDDKDCVDNEVDNDDDDNNDDEKDDENKDNNWR